MKKLFISFTALLREMSLGNVTRRDLDTGLFYFGCTKEHAVDPWQDETNEIEWFFEDDIARGRQAHKQLKAAVLRAEREGRAVFIQLEESNTYEQLNDLLVANGYQPLSGWEWDWDYQYNYPQVEELVQKASLPLAVVR